MAKVEGADRLIATLRSRAEKAKRDSNLAVIVGFTAFYASFVHENLEAVHPTGQAKFLEQPARQLRPILKAMIAAALKAGQTLAQALLQAGLRLQREAQMLCPVDTGALRASAFTRLIGGEQ